MKSISPQLESHLQQEVTTLTDCWKIERKDGTVLGFTSHIEDITYDTITYKAETGISRTAIDQSVGLSTDNLDLVGLLDDSALTDADIRAGIYRDAQVWYFMLNYEDLTQGIMKLDYGYIGEITLKRGTYIAEFRSLMQRLDQSIGSRYGRDCRWELGDSNCKVDLAPFTHSGTVETGSTARRTFVDATNLIQSADYFTYGKVNWLTGLNAGTSMDIKKHTAGGNIELKFPMPFDIQVGDTFEAIAGCNHLLKMSGDVWGTAYTGDCRVKFDNVVNFGGFPDLPTDDQLLRGPK